MRMSLVTWSGVACLAGAWLLASGYLGRPHPAWLWPALLLAGSACLIAGRRPTLPAPPSRPAGRGVVLALGLVLLLAVPFLPWPEALGPLLAALGLGLGLTARASGARWRGAEGLLVAGVLWLGMGAVVSGYQAIVAQAPYLPWPLREFLSLVAGLTRIEGTTDGAELVLFSMREKHAVAATWTLFLDPGTACFLAGGVAMLLGSSARHWPSVMLRFGGAMLLWLLLRTTALLAIYLHLVLRTEHDAPLEHAAIFWNEAILLLLLIPPVLIAWRSCRMPPWAGAAAGTGAGGGADAEPGRTEETLVASRWTAVVPAFLLLLLAAATGTLALVHQPSGARKAGRIVIDEYHCRVDDWTRQRWPQKEFDTTSTLRPFGTDWYGEAAGYNYASLHAYASRFYRVERNETPIDASVLAECDVLLLKVPSRYYTAAEVAAVRGFVATGGGLLLIGEHTSVFGSSVPLNQIARGYGFEFRYDCLFGMDEKYVQSYEPAFVPHPVVQHLDALDFAVSCSIDPELGSGRAVIRDNGLLGLGADYHAPNYYPQPHDRPEMLPGAFVQLWAADAGDGRVLAFTDSTIFANFSFYEPGKRELLLGMLEWLNHRPGASPLWWLVPAILLFSGAVVVTVSGPGRRDPLVSLTAVVALSAVVAGWALGCAGARAMHGAAMPVPTADRPLITVAIERSFCPTVHLPSGGFIGSEPQGLGIFERSIQRLTRPHSRTAAGETWMTCRAGLEDSFGADLVVIPYPTEPVPADTIAAVVRYVDGGGKVLLLESPSVLPSSSDALLAPFGLRVDRSTALAGSMQTIAEELPFLELEGAYALSGGVPIATLEGHTVAAWQQHGKGLVVVLAFGGRFENVGMGGSPNLPPDAKARAAHDFEHALLRAIARGSPPEPTR